MTTKHRIDDYGDKLVGRTIVLYNGVGTATEPHRVVEFKPHGPGQVQNAIATNVLDDSSHTFPVRDFEHFSFAEDVEPEAEA